MRAVVEYPPSPNPPLAPMATSSAWASMGLAAMSASSAAVTACTPLRPAPPRPASRAPGPLLPPERPPAGGRKNAEARVPSAAGRPTDRVLAAHMART